MLKKEYSARSRDCLLTPTLNYQILRNSRGCVQKFAELHRKYMNLYFLIDGSNRAFVNLLKIKFDEPLDWQTQVAYFFLFMEYLGLLDYARRYFERKGDSSSIKRAKEIRRLYKQIIQDYVYIVRSIIPEQIIEDRIKIFYDRSEQI